MNQSIFKGIATAMITPFHADGTVDYAAFGRMIDFQIDNGINGHFCNIVSYDFQRHG